MKTDLDHWRRMAAINMELRREKTQIFEAINKLHLYYQSIAMTENAASFQNAIKQKFGIWP